MRREESAGGISESRRDVNMSSSLAVWRVVFVWSTEARREQAGAPRVLPPRWISVIVSEAIKGLRWGSISSAVSSLRDCPEREKMLGGDIMLGNRGVVVQWHGRVLVPFLPVL